MMKIIMRERGRVGKIYKKKIHWMRELYIYKKKKKRQKSMNSVKQRQYRNGKNISWHGKIMKCPRGKEGKRKRRK